MGSSFVLLCVNDFWLIPSLGGGVGGRIPNLGSLDLRNRNRTVLHSSPLTHSLSVLNSMNQILKRKRNDKRSKDLEICEFRTDDDSVISSLLIYF